MKDTDLTDHRKTVRLLEENIEYLQRCVLLEQDTKKSHQGEKKILMSWTLN